MKDYYYILDISNNAIENQVYEGYKRKISRFNNLPFHTKQMIEDIKTLKEALYVLSDKNKRMKYDIKLEEHKKYMNDDENPFDNTKICNRLFSIKFDNQRI
jgi:DnaJ-class molecular chaperone